MVIQSPQSEKRPYAATANVMAVLERARSRNLPDRIGGEFFTLSGVGTNVHGRVSQALVFLGLIEADGTPLDSLQAMAQAPEAEFRELLAASVREAYAAEFQKVDPAQDSQPTILDAFRRYQPRSQTDRMVMLFLGLCREAGIKVKDVPRERKMTGTPKATRPRRGSLSPQTQVQKRSNGASNQSSPATPPIGGLLFGVTEADIAALDEGDFSEVWTALGKVARARARASQEPPPSQKIRVEEEEQEEEEESVGE